MSDISNRKACNARDGGCGFCAIADGLLIGMGTKNIPLTHTITKKVEVIQRLDIKVAFAQVLW